MAPTRTGRIRVSGGWIRGVGRVRVVGWPGSPPADFSAPELAETIGIAVSLSPTESQSPCGALLTVRQLACPQGDHATRGVAYVVAYWDSRRPIIYLHRHNVILLDVVVDADERTESNWYAV